MGDFRRALYTSHALFDDDTSIPRQFLCTPGFRQLILALSSLSSVATSIS
jgi:hypothetical protein